jgi:hypothetical protein
MKRDSSLRRPTRSQEGTRKKKSACFARNDSGACDCAQDRRNGSSGVSGRTE